MKEKLSKSFYYISKEKFPFPDDNEVKKITTPRELEIRQKSRLHLLMHRN